MLNEICIEPIDLFFSAIPSKTQKLNPVVPTLSTQIGDFDARGRLSRG